jgi:hypothetical protein
MELLYRSNSPEDDLAGPGAVSSPPPSEVVTAGGSEEGTSAEVETGPEVSPP